MRVLLGAFDPFGGEKINPALEAIKGVCERLGEIEIRRVEIPTVFVKSYQVLLEEARAYQPDVILVIGQAGGRYEISLERVAINLDDARIEDNEGNQPIDQRIFEDGENAYFSNLPIKAMLKEMREAGIPSAISNTAGTFVCNHIMYAMMHYIYKFQIAQRGGFIHIPYFPSQVVGRENAPCMDRQTVIKGIEIAIESIGKYSKDIQWIGGKEF